MRPVLLLAFVGACGFSVPAATDGAVDSPPDTPAPVTWTVDATSGKPTPASTAEWTDFLAAKGLAIAPPGGLWLMQDAAGPATDAIGTVSLAPFGAPSYRVSVPGWTRLATATADMSVAGFFNNTAGSLPDVSTSSMTVLALVQIPSAPPAPRSVLFAGANAPPAYGRVDVDNARHLTMVVGGAPTAGTRDHGDAPFAILLRLDHTAAKQRLQTRLETVSPSYVPLVASRGIYVGGAGYTAPAARYLYVAAWYGSNAELTDAEATALLAALDW